jgi:hypothetical protein
MLADILSSHFLSKNIKIKISETWSLTLREENRLIVSENKVLRRIFGSKKEEVIRRLEEIAY